MKVRSEATTSLEEVSVLSMVQSCISPGLHPAASPSSACSGWLPVFWSLLAELGIQV